MSESTDNPTCSCREGGAVARQPHTPSGPGCLNREDPTVSEHVRSIDPDPLPPQTWPENAVPLPEQLREWLLSLSEPHQLRVLGELIDHGQRSARCFQEGHRYRIRQLEGRVIELVLGIARLSGSRERDGKAKP